MKKTTVKLNEGFTTKLNKKLGYTEIKVASMQALCWKNGILVAR